MYVTTYVEDACSVLTLCCSNIAYVLILTRKPDDAYCPRPGRQDTSQSTCTDINYVHVSEHIQTA